MINETLPVIKAKHTHRAIIKTPTAGNMATDFTSVCIDFSDMPIGFLQAYWEGVVGHAADDAYFVAKASGFRDLATFDVIRGSFEPVTTAVGSRVWNLGLIGYRYALVEFHHGSITDGQCIVIASGKKT